MGVARVHETVRLAMTCPIRVRASQGIVGWNEVDGVRRTFAQLAVRGSGTHIVRMVVAGKTCSDGWREMLSLGLRGVKPHSMRDWMGTQNSSGPQEDTGRGGRPAIVAGESQAVVTFRKNVRSVTLLTFQVRAHGGAHRESVAPQLAYPV